MGVGAPIADDEVGANPTTGAINCSSAECMTPPEDLCCCCCARAAKGSCAGALNCGANVPVAAGIDCCSNWAPNPLPKPGTGVPSVLAAAPPG